MIAFQEIMGDTVKLEDFKSMLRFCIYQSLKENKNDKYLEWAELIEKLTDDETDSLMKHIILSAKYKPSTTKELREEAN